LRRQRRWQLWPGALMVIVVAAVVLVAINTDGSPTSVRDRGWRSDIAYLATELPRVHVDGLVDVSHSGWDAAAGRLEAQVPRLGRGQLIVGLLRMVAMIHDDETSVGLTPARFYPFDARWLGGHLYLLAVPSADRQFLGAELVSIDGHPIAAVLARLRPEIDYQDPGVLRYQEAQLVGDADLLYWLGLTRSPRSADFTVRTAAGTVQALPLAAQVVISSDRVTHRPPMAAVPVPLYERHNAWPYWMVILRARHAVYLKYNQCLDNDGFQRLAARALKVLRRHPGYRLIVDLRGNGGGDTTPFQELVSRIRADPAINVRGRIFGLIDSSTDSSAGLDASKLGQETRAILMGQQIEDPIDEFGNDNLSFPLPYSRLIIQYTTKIVNPAKKHHGAPDIVVAPTLHQVMNGTDPVLQRALS
jgi:hypothetical protein